MKITDPVTVTTGEITLLKLRRAMAQHVSPPVLATSRIKVDHMIDQIAVRFTAIADFPIEPLKEVSGTAIFKTPATWFSHFRLRYFPNFLISRFPVQWETREQTITIEVGAVYPKLPIAFPDQRDKIRYYMRPEPAMVFDQYPSTDKID